ncbi:MAG TPA: hypothetical protein VHO26_09825 [Propionibacteriaceae bacterium]|nr:hypothetical protein [Propionibacteriaceae bacterium]
MFQSIPATLLLAYSNNDDYLAADAASTTLARGFAHLRGILGKGRSGRPQSGARTAPRLQARPVHAA